MPKLRDPFDDLALAENWRSIDWEHCHSLRGVFIPGCMGGAVYGRERCTCKTPPSIYERIERLEKQVRELRDKQEKHGKQL